MKYQITVEKRAEIIFLFFNTDFKSLPEIAKKAKCSKNIVDLVLTDYLKPTIEEDGFKILPSKMNYEN